IVARPLIPGSVNISHFLMLENVSDRPILVSWDNGEPNRLRLATNDSIRGIVTSLISGETVICIESKSEMVMPVLKAAKYDDIDAENMLELELRWKFAQPRVWKRDRSILISIRKRDFDNMVEGYIAAQPSDDNG